jgi:hypothetical protein
MLATVCPKLEALYFNPGGGFDLNRFLELNSLFTELRTLSISLDIPWDFVQLYFNLSNNLSEYTTLVCSKVA